MYLKQVGNIHILYTHSDEHKRLGEFYKEVDGYYVFDPEPTGSGYYSEFYLEYLLQTLEGLNKEWDEIIQNDPVFNGEI